MPCKKIIQTVFESLRAWWKNDQLVRQQGGKSFAVLFVTFS
jgi:hypothetical protein